MKIGEKMVYAIIENGGKQYKVVEGKTLETDLLPEEIGKKKIFGDILLLTDGEKVEVGTPFLANVSVEATVVDHFKGPKITVFKYRAKQRYRVKTGHRQTYTRLVVDSILYPGKKEQVKEEKVIEEKKPLEKKSTAQKKTTASKAVKKATAPAKKPATKKAASTKAAAKEKGTKDKKTTTKKITASKK